MTDPAMSQSNVPNFVELGEAGIGQGYHGIGVRVNLPEMMLHGSELRLTGQVG